MATQYQNKHDELVEILVATAAMDTELNDGQTHRLMLIYAQTLSTQRTLASALLCLYDNFDDAGLVTLLGNVQDQMEYGNYQPKDMADWQWTAGVIRKALALGRTERAYSPVR